MSSIYTILKAYTVSLTLILWIPDIALLHHTPHTLDTNLKELKASTEHSDLAPSLIRLLNFLIKWQKNTVNLGNRQIPSAADVFHWMVSLPDTLQYC